MSFAASRSLSVEIMYADRSDFVTIFTPFMVEWKTVKQKLEECFKAEPKFNTNDIVRSVCLENRWSWREGMAEDGPDVIIFAE